MSEDTLTWLEFLQEAKSFLKISDRLNDVWSLQEKDLNEPNTFLTYKEKRHCKLSLQADAPDEVLELEYHVVYSISYQVPVLYFQAHKEDGSLIGLDAAWRLFRDADQYQRTDMLSILTQMEHPVLFRPFLALHPCRTAELLAQFKIAKSSNRILTFISLMGPYVGLNLANEYGKIE